jgi:hypothetical protein
MGIIEIEFFPVDFDEVSRSGRSLQGINIYSVRKGRRGGEPVCLKPPVGEQF